MTSLELINRTIGPSQTEGMVERHRGRQWISGETEGLKKKKSEENTEKESNSGKQRDTARGEKGEWVNGGQMPNIRMRMVMHEEEARFNVWRGHCFIRYRGQFRRGALSLWTFGHLTEIQLCHNQRTHM